MPIGRFLKVGAAGLWVAFMVAIGVAEFLDRDLPTQWGTFTEQSRECQNGPRYSSCTIHGQWLSHDGRVVKADVVLDGDTDEDGTARAAYRPGGAMDVDDIVHTERWVNAGLWMPWLMATGGATFIVVLLRAGRSDSK